MRAFLFTFFVIFATGALADELTLPEDIGEFDLAPVPGHTFGAGDEIFTNLAAFDVDITADGTDLGGLNVYKFHPDAPAAMKAHLIGRYTSDLGAIHGDLAGATNVEGTIWCRLRLVEINEWYRYDGGLDAILQYMQPKGVGTREAVDFLAAFDKANGG